MFSKCFNVSKLLTTKKWKKENKTNVLCRTSRSVGLKCTGDKNNTPIANMASVTRKRGFSVATVAKGETVDI